MIENVRCIMKSKLQSDAAMIEIGGRHLDWLSMQNLDIATCWIYSKSVCIYSTSISLSNNRHRVSYEILIIQGNIHSLLVYNGKVKLNDVNNA